MKRSKIRTIAAASAAGVCLYALSIPAFGQDAPESLLPEGFEDPVEPTPAPPAPTTPTPAPPASPAPPPPSTARPAPSPSAPRRITDESDFAEGDEFDDFGLAEIEFEEIPPEYELPPEARRSLALVGPLTPQRGGFGREAFEGINGLYATLLMRRLDAPGPSRWQHIALRRALLSEIPTPSNVSAPDWVAERAWLLLRMGEVDGARMLVQRVDSDRYTPKLYAVAMQTALASADPAAFCPLTTGARRTAETPAWIMADSICAGLGGEAARATAQLAQARRDEITNGFDLLLGQKVANAGGNSRATTIEWEGVERLNAWRFGMATATGEDIPAELFSTVGRQIHGWRARAGTLDIEERITSAPTAAILGVLSNEAMVTMYSALLPELEPEDVPGSVVGNLRAAYVRQDLSDRLTAMEEIWEGPGAFNNRYAGLILTARAAARVDPQDALASRSGDLIASMLTAGLDTQAARWAGVVNGNDGSGVDQAWALLATGAPDEAVDISFGRLDAYADRAGRSGRHRASLLAAALAGLGRLNESEIDQADGAFDLGISNETIWTRQLERAARSGQVGVVALLASIGMQSRGWGGVPPVHLYHIVRAYRLAGREAEARMIAAEAVTRA